MYAGPEKAIQDFAEQIAQVWDLRDMAALDAHVKKAFGFNSLLLYEIEYVMLECCIRPDLRERRPVWRDRQLLAEGEIRGHHWIIGEYGLICGPDDRYGRWMSSSIKGGQVDRTPQIYFETDFRRVYVSEMLAIHSPRPTGLSRRSKGLLSDGFLNLVPFRDREEQYYHEQGFKPWPECTGDEPEWQ